MIFGVDAFIHTPFPCPLKLAWVDVNSINLCEYVGVGVYMVCECVHGVWVCTWCVGVYMVCGCVHGVRVCTWCVGVYICLMAVMTV